MCLMFLLWKNSSYFDGRGITIFTYFPLRYNCSYIPRKPLSAKTISLLLVLIIMVDHYYRLILISQHVSKISMSFVSTLKVFRLIFLTCLHLSSLVIFTQFLFQNHGWSYVYRFLSTHYQVFSWFYLRSHIFFSIVSSSFQPPPANSAEHLLMT